MIRSRINCTRVILCLLTLMSTVGSLGISPAEAARLGKRWGFYVTYDPSSKASLLAHLSHLSQLDVVVPDYFDLKPPGVLVGAGDSALDETIQRSGTKALPLVHRPTAGAV